MAKFDKEIFDKVKKGDSIKVTFDSNQIVGGGFNKGVEKELLVKSKNLVGKGKSYESEKITFSNVANPNGVKYYAYKRKDGSVGFAIGDMPISNVQIADKYANGGKVGEFEKLHNEYRKKNNWNDSDPMDDDDTERMVDEIAKQKRFDSKKKKMFLQYADEREGNMAKGGGVKGFTYSIGGL